MGRRFLVMLVAALWASVPLISRSQAPAPRSSSADTESSKTIFRRLLAEYKRHPEFFVGVLPKGDKTFDDVDVRLLDRLAPPVLEARFREFNGPYLALLKSHKTRLKTLAEKEKRLAETPISDLKRRPKLELDVQAIRSQLRPVRRNLFLLSLDANVSFRKALETIQPADQPVLAARPAAPAPTAAVVAANPASDTKTDPKPDSKKMPGVFGGSREARTRAKDAEKINLTPVDDEFYSTALGRKLESDLGGRADAWSYDYGKDELYVQVGGEIGKVRVKQEGAGVRFIQTRVGPDFMDPRGRDQRVELGAKGRFLTGSKGEETLFGKMPSTTPALADETLPPGHFHGDGHDHGHKH